MKDLAQKLENLVQGASHWTEVRYHRRNTQTLQVQKGLVKQAKSSVTSGVGVRALVEGTWGFSSTSDLSKPSLEKALKNAIDCAKSISGMKKSKVAALPEAKLARGDFKLPGYEKLQKMPLNEKLETVRKAEQSTRDKSNQIQSSSCLYNEIFEDKIVVTTDGANAISQLARNEFRLSAFADMKGTQAAAHQTVGRTGTWECLFNPRSWDKLSEDAAQLAIDLVNAPRVEGGLATLILAPSIVGLLSHEAIGHTVEADFVLSGSVAAGKIGTQVASPIIDMVDGGTVENAPYGGGDLLVDDEGVPTQSTEIIKGGKLVSYLHNRESAAHFNVAPTGNARAWLYHDEPLIRMRNTYIRPGNQSIDEIIASTKNGYLVDVPLGGQADATGEFMFGVQKVLRIENGKVTKLLRGATISGQAFEVLKTADAVSREFKLDLGAGYCGKGQPAKVDAGGPYVRCRAMIGGVQE